MKFKLIGITGSKGVLGSYILKNFKGVKFDCFKGDIRKKSDISSWLGKKKFFAIFHLAAVVPTKQVLRDYQKAVKVNSYGTNYLANQIIKNKSTNWLLFASTSHVYNFSETSIKEKSKLLTISEYGKTKVLAEKYLLKKNLSTCIIRIFSYTIIVKIYNLSYHLLIRNF